jgi:hypothetical protein
MTVKKAEKKKRGRPQGDPDDLRTERIALRIHSDLLFELTLLARLEGVTRSVLVERLLIRLVNDHYSRTLVDKVGRYVSGPPKDDPAHARIRSHYDTNMRIRTAPRRKLLVTKK